MDGGSHEIVMEYYENGVEAVARLGYEKVADPVPETAWRAEYGNTPETAEAPTIPTGPPDLERDDETLDFDWGEGSPGTGIAADRFVSRWTKTVTLSAGVYRFTGAHDDGIRAYIDDVPVVDEWTHGNEAYSVRASRVLVRADRWGRIGGAASAPAPDAAGRSVRRRVLRQPELSGDPVLTRNDDAVDFDWFGGSPGAGVPADNFSARWTKTKAY